MLRKALAAGAVFVLWIAGSVDARAVEPDELPFADARTYFQAGGSNGIQLFDLLSTDSAGNGVGLNLRFGKRVAPHFSVESSFDWIGGFDRTRDPSSGSNDIWTLGANVKAFLLTDRVQPYLLAGMGGAFVSGKVAGIDTSGNGFMGRFGVGLDVYATERIGMSLESAYVLPTGGSATYENVTISWSLFYRFNNEDDE